MSLVSIQLCHMDRNARSGDVHGPEPFTVTVWSDNQKMFATFDCVDEAEAIQLRNAIREHAQRLRRVADYNR
jgi:hypothetical protein